jgi:hypothetical protein
MARSVAPARRPETVAEFERILADFSPTSLPSEEMPKLRVEVRDMWVALAATLPYEALTIWVMKTWPNRTLERVDAMVRTAIAGAHYVRDGEWTIAYLIGVVGKCGRRSERIIVHEYLGVQVKMLNIDSYGFELADETQQGSMTSSLGSAIVAYLVQSLGEHSYMVTPSASFLLDRFADIAVDHLNSVRMKSISDQCPDGLGGLSLFAAARPTARANKANRMTNVIRDFPQPTSVALSHLLLGTDHNPDSALLWRLVSGISPLDVPAETLADWRSELPALCPSILAFTDRRRRRLKDRSRNGEDLRQDYEQAANCDVDLLNRAMAI